MNDRVFEEIPCIESLLEILEGEKVVVLTIHLAGARGAGGARYRVMNLAGFCQLATKRGFP